VTFWKYLLKNKAWLMFGFMLLCGAWEIVWVMQGDAGPDLIAMGVSVGLVLIVWIIGNYISWRKLKP